jgi:signal transduction histidine kinase/DNA-binding response OmpR family regulator
MNTKLFESRRGLIYWIVLANVFFGVVIGLTLWNGYQQQLHLTEARAVSTSMTLERSLSGMLGQVEILLLSISEILEEELKNHKKIDAQHSKSLINKLVQHVPGIVVVSYSDAKGEVAANIGFPEQSPAISIQDRDYFILSKSNAEQSMVSSKPVLGRISGKWVMIFARSYLDPTGIFAGVVSASIELNRFSDLFAAMNLGEDATIVLNSDLDYEILARYPLPNDRSIIGSRMLPQFVDRMKMGTTLVTLLDTSKDGIERSRAIRKIESRPYWVTVALSTKTELAQWRNQMLEALVVWCTFVVLTAIAGWQLNRGWRRQVEMDTVLRSTLDATDNGILVVVNDGDVLYKNLRFLQMWKIPHGLWHSSSEQVLLGQVVGDLINPSAFLDKVKALYSDFTVDDYNEFEFKDGRVFESVALPMKLTGNVQGRVWSFRDITERKNNERKIREDQSHLEELIQQRTISLIAARDDAQRSNSAKSVFLSNMSHELRTPLNAILGFSQLLNRDKSLSATGLKQVATINRTGQHLLSLINDVLEVSRIEAGKAAINRQPFVLFELLSEIVEMIRQRAEAKGLVFKIESAIDAKLVVEGDTHHLKQVLINLLGNAVKYTDSGSVQLTVSQLNEQVNGQMSSEICFEISDTGPGIAALDQEKIFQPFYQTEAGIARGDGTGLGLAISQQYTTMMGGRLSLQSQLGHGSVFSLTVPLPATDTAVATIFSGRVIGLQQGQPVIRVLVVDDKADNRELVKEYLVMAGFEVQTANDGLQAVAAFQSWQPHLIWMDMRMPVLDGYAATRKIRQLQGGDKVKIVALTASAFEEDRLKIMSAGCDEMVKKPLEEDKLFGMLEKLLGVRYKYAEVVSTTVATTSKLDLSILTTAQRQELGRAASELDIKSVRHVIKQVAESHVGLAAQLDELAQGFRLEQIASLCRDSAKTVD